MNKRKSKASVKVTYFVCSVISGLMAIAEKSIHVVVSHIDNYGLKLLMKAAERGIKVLVVTSRKPSLQTIHPNLLIVEPLNPSHHKILIIDEKIVVKGSANLTRTEIHCLTGNELEIRYYSDRASAEQDEIYSTAIRLTPPRALKHIES